MTSVRIVDRYLALHDMRIALVNQPSDTVDPDCVGSSIVLWNQEVAQHLSKRCEVIVYAPRTHGQSETRDHNGIEYRWLSTRADRILAKARKAAQLILPRRRPAFASPICHLTYAWKLARDLRRTRCDIVHLTNHSQLVPIIRALNPDIKIVLQMQCDWLIQLDPALVEPRLRRADRIIGCSEYITDRIRARFPSVAHKCQAICNGASAGQPATATSKRILFVGRISPEKGVHVLIDAFKQILERHPDAQLVLVGYTSPLPKSLYLDLAEPEEQAALSPYYEQDYLQLLRNRLSSDQSKQVTFTGSVTNPEALAHYRSAQIAVFPSTWHEPFGIVVAEAMAHALPVVATRSGGIPEIIEDGTSGILVDRNDAPALANALLKLLDDPQLRHGLGRAARERAATCFSWERVAQDVWREYQQLLSEPKPSTQVAPHVHAVVE